MTRGDCQISISLDGIDYEPAQGQPLLTSGDGDDMTFSSAPNPDEAMEGLHMATELVYIALQPRALGCHFPSATGLNTEVQSWHLLRRLAAVKSVNNMVLPLDR